MWVQGAHNLRVECKAAEKKELLYLFLTLLTAPSVCPSAEADHGADDSRTNHLRIDLLIYRQLICHKMLKFRLHSHPISDCGGLQPEWRFNQAAAAKPFDTRISTPLHTIHESSILTKTTWHMRTTSSSISWWRIRYQRSQLKRVKLLLTSYCIILRKAQTKLLSNEERDVNKAAV